MKSRLSRYLIPTAVWSGRLVFKSGRGRRSDGGVLIELTGTPDEYRRLIGKKIPLVWDYSFRMDIPLASEITDIDFTDDTIASISNGNIHPMRLNGLQAVTPLETLAGSRDGDDVLVMLKGVSVIKTKGEIILRVVREPVQISGSMTGLVRFVKPAKRDCSAYHAVFFDRDKRKYSKETVVIRLEKGELRNNLTVPQSSTADIHLSPLNEGGWFVFGDYTKNGFLVKALQPREPFLAENAAEISGRKKCSAFINSGSWTSVPQGSFKSTMLSRKKNRSAQKIAEGNSGLLTHVFGWIGGPAGEKPDSNGMVTGHFAFGTARAMKDPFAGELMWNIEYRQAYCHNPEGIIAGTYAWHAYMGDLRRGWMYLLPVSDSIIIDDKLTEEIFIRGRKTNFIQELEFELERMNARMRSGGGTGLAPVNMAVSCSQESSIALYTALSRISASLKKDISLKNPDTPRPFIVKMKQLMKTCNSFMKVIRPFGIVPPRWNRYMMNFSPPVRPPHGIAMRRDALLSKNSILPRPLNDRLVKAALKTGARVNVIRTDQIGGYIDGISPMWPSTFLRKFKP